MTDKQLKDWMERFFDAELTVDEERELYRYLCANEVSAELRKDREVILALCSTAEEDIELPEGAAERLEEMLDGLEEMKTHHKKCCSAALLVGDKSPIVATDAHSRRPCKGGLEAPQRRRSLPPRKGWGGSFLLRAACAAAVVAAVFLAIPHDESKHTDEATVLTMVDDVDKDTFDNPEEAMQCLMAAYGDIQYAMNTTQRQTHEAYQTLEQSQSIIREMFNMNIN
ncbi:MAG: hypothetical protein IKJ18_09085 [Bacteroidaceae bacterium]|nr:hypothetical protein [Bacteroidaceae bacterium]